MAGRAVGTLIVVTAFAVGGVRAAASPSIPPRFAITATSATANDQLSVRVATAARAAHEVRFYLASSTLAASVHSRFDTRLYFIGAVRPIRGARVAFTVPPLSAGRYTLVYWRSDTGQVHSQPSANLVVRPVTPAVCPVTSPNGNAPRGLTAEWQNFALHSNGGLFALLPRDGELVTNALGGWKMLWLAAPTVGGALTVQYEQLDNPDPAAGAPVVSGTLSGYDGLSWNSRHSLQAGCWRFTGRLQDVTLSFVLQVKLGSS